MKHAKAVGTNKSRLAVLAKIPGNPYLTYGLVGMVANQLNEAVNKWKADHSLSLAGLLDLDNKEFEDAKWELLRTLNTEAHTFVNTHDFGAEFMAVQLYERKFPGKSGRKCCEINESLSA